MTKDYDYEYLGWGTKVDPEDIQKKADYSELEKMDFLRTDRESIVYEEKEEESNEYNVWFFEADAGKPWGEGDEGRKQRREAAKVKIQDFVGEVGPGAEEWKWYRRTRGIFSWISKRQEERYSHHSVTGSYILKITLSVLRYTSKTTDCNCKAGRFSMRCLVFLSFFLARFVIYYWSW
ncbi:MAG: hypothetical protein ACOYJU_06735 [Anaerovoracaceae bacterium]|jgi:hypothetical protein